MADISWTPIHVYLDRQPTFDELASQAWHLARNKYFADDTWRDRLVFMRESIRLRSAARWAGLQPLTLGRYYLRHVLLRIVPLVALGFLFLYARDAIRRDLLGNGAPVADFLILISASLILGSAWGLWRWPAARQTLTWADSYRAEFLSRQEQLLSPVGWRGWRLVRRDGGYVFVPSERGSGGV